MKIYIYTITLSSVVVFSGQNVYAEVVPPIQLSNLVLPPALNDVLQEGLNVPIYLQYDKAALNVKSKQKIADAVLYIRDKDLYIREVYLDESLQITELSVETVAQLNAIKDQKISANLDYKLSENAQLELDLKSLYLQLKVDEAALGTKVIARSDLLEGSTIDNFSSIMSYRLGTYYNEFSGEGNSSSYINLNSVSSLNENHFILNGALYGLGTNNSNTEVYRALYERDVDGYRFAAGMMDSWSLQSIASLNGFNTSKIYGVSFGNITKTVTQNSTLSLTPITVFLPSAGTIQLYREGRLLSIQNFPLGSHEVDTSTLPSGVYSVDVKTIVNGQEVSSTIANVNKSFEKGSLGDGKLKWQMFGGMLEYNNLIGDKNYNKFQDPKENYENSRADELNREQKGWLLGVALNKSYAVLSGASLRSSVYTFSNNNNNDQNLVTELDSNVSLTQNLRVSWQTMLASDKTFRNVVSASYNLPKGYGSLWGSREYTTIGDKLSIEKRDYYSFGTNFNLKQLHKSLGFITAGYSKDLQHKNEFTNLEYSQNLFNSKYADFGIRAGMQKYKYQNTGNTTQKDDKYIYLDLRLPLSKWFKAGVSSRNESILATASYRQDFQNSFIKNVGVELSKVVREKEGNNDFSDVAVSGYMGYQNKYNEGSLSASTEGKNYSLSYTSQGTIAYAAQQVALSHSTLESGVIINTALKDNGKMSAIINGQTHQLSGMTNFIPLAPYQKYTVELANDRTSLDSVNIVKGRKSSMILYPGNVSVLNPEVQQMVTVFGRIHYPSGELAKNVNINNHIGKTITDGNGEFSIDIDKRYPVLTLIEDNGSICESKLSLQRKDSAVWVGDIQCQIKKVSSQTNLLEVRQ